MLALNLVLDTNVVVSAVLTPSGLPARALQFVLTSPSYLYVSEAILEEYEGLLARPKFGTSPADRARTLAYIRARSHVIAPKQTLSVCDDPDDNIFLECADAARADYLVTGNLRHFPEFWKGTKVITARDLINLVAPHLS